MEIWQTVSATLACVLMLVHCTCLFFIRNRLIWDKLPVVVSQSFSCILYSCFTLLRLLLPSTSALLEHIEIFVIGSYIPFYGSIILLIQGMTRQRDSTEIKARESEGKLVTFSWCLYLVWLILIYIIIYQYKVSIKQVLKFGEHHLTLFGLGAIIVMLAFMAFSPCYKMMKENRIRTTRRNEHRSNRHQDVIIGTNCNLCMATIAPWSLSAVLFLFELTPKIVFLFIDDTYRWMVLCRLLQRIVNGFICISFTQNLWDMSTPSTEGNRKKRQQPGQLQDTVGGQGEEEEDDKEDDETKPFCEGQHLEQHQNTTIRYNGCLYPKILVVITDEYENVREQTLFGQDVFFIPTRSK